jgi:hypothetical protein
MRRAGETLTAWVGIATGVLGLVSVFGPLVVPGLGVVVIGASILTTLWALLVGRRLLRLASEVARAA